MCWIDAAELTEARPGWDAALRLVGGCVTVCLQCGGAKVQPERAKCSTDATRIPSAIWRAAVELDPFCSRSCAEAHHGAVQAAEKKCAHCDGLFQVPLSGRGQHRAYCSERCSKQAGWLRRSARRKGDAVAQPGYCAGCGRPWDEEGSTSGCYLCWQREYRRRRRNDPDARQLDNEKRAVRRAKSTPKVSAVPTSSAILPRGQGDQASLSTEGRPGTLQQQEAA